MSIEEQHTETVRAAFSSMDQLIDKCWGEIRHKPSTRIPLLRNLRALIYDEAQALVELLRHLQSSNMAVVDTNGEAQQIIDDAIDVIDYMDKKLKKGITLVPKE
jgi:hypothetical protein